MNNEQRTTNNEQRTTNNEQRTTNNEQRTTNNEQQSFGEIQKLVKMVPFFDEFSTKNLKNSISYITTLNYSANHPILLEHSWGSAVYFIVDGWVKIRVHNINGKEVTLNVVGRGEIIGEISALEEMPHFADAIALSPTTVIMIPASNFLSLLQTEILAGIRLARLMAKRFRQINQQLQLREVESPLRVAGILLFLAKNWGKIIGKRVCIPRLPRSELASIVGLTRETVSRALTKLEKDGLILRGDDKSKIYILNLNELEKLINVPIYR
jgi:CRP/FNR family cyclic AMP-dependent transcriptional regulator